MNSSLLLAVCCVLAVEWTTAVTVKQATLTGHNDIRRQEAKAEHGSNLYELVWDATLAHGAKAWADKCNFEHQHQHNIGENLYYSSPRTHTDDYYIHRALTSWMTEKTFNHGNFDCCYHGHYDCCHYTQVVAARTTKVACAVAHCDTMTKAGHAISHNAAYVVCDYSPMGNMAINGNHAAYASGAPCSNCHGSDKCHDGLCVTTA
ncbi:GLIPR1-like protein 1 [Littorina saxatilis]|uniref:SCP domain-containing protein n=1 Tax=Littorina saxatilis TaxID=31220 RepID=A0AAN9B739_9CAEN